MCPDTLCIFVLLSHPLPFLLLPLPFSTLTPLAPHSRFKGIEAPWQGESRGGWDKDGNLIIGGNEIKKIGKDGAEDSGGGKILW
jgi:hypothetical protein